MVENLKTLWVVREEPTNQAGNLKSTIPSLSMKQTEEFKKSCKSQWAACWLTSRDTMGLDRMRWQRMVQGHWLSKDINTQTWLQSWACSEDEKGDITGRGLSVFGRTAQQSQPYKGECPWMSEWVSEGVSNQVLFLGLVQPSVSSLAVVLSELIRVQS